MIIRTFHFLILNSYLMSADDTRVILVTEEEISKKKKFRVKWMQNAEDLFMADSITPNTAVILERFKDCKVFDSEQDVWRTALTDEDKQGASEYGIQRVEIPGYSFPIG